MKKKTTKKTPVRRATIKTDDAALELKTLAQLLGSLLSLPVTQDAIEAARHRRELIESEAVQAAAKINQMIRERADGLWTTGDGSRVPVASMTDSHLFYALAKARRGEYPDTYSRKVEVSTLEAEALRRLLKVVGWNGGTERNGRASKFKVAVDKLRWGCTDAVAAGPGPKRAIPDGSGPKDG